MGKTFRSAPSALCGKKYRLCPRILVCSSAFPAWTVSFPRFCAISFPLRCHVSAPPSTYNMCCLSCVPVGFQSVPLLLGNARILNIMYHSMEWLKRLFLLFLWIWGAAPCLCILVVSVVVLVVLLLCRRVILAPLFPIPRDSSFWECRFPICPRYVPVRIMYISVRWSSPWRMFLFQIVRISYSVLFAEVNLSMECVSRWKCTCLWNVSIVEVSWSCPWNVWVT